MQYTVIGDLHLTPNTLGKADLLFNQIESYNNTVIWLGDLLDTKEVIRGTCLNFLYSKLKQSKLNHILLVGNHDYFNLQCEDHSLKVLEALPNVIVVSNVYRENNLTFIPYCTDESFLTIIKGLPKSTVLFCHQGITGFDYGNGYIAKDEIDSNSLKDFKTVIAGHFHKYQKKQNITYLGTPYSHSFGESNQDKFIGIFNTVTCNLELLQTAFPKHITITVDADSNTDVPVLDNSNFNRIILNGSLEAIKKYRHLNKERFAESKIIERCIETSNYTFEVEPEKDLISHFETWAKCRNMSDDIIKLGSDILKYSKEM